MVGPSIISSHPEPVIVDRITRGNRHLWYRLEVIQQPERARACGAGPKSSADRRPVDPPPVVELRIFEGPTIEHAKDVTFNYNANFFLYATLEHARVIAHGRVQAPSAATPPVLTGMPVSGMAYLDRPQEAGYFLFPDLSVRHEGRYRLKFSLYEQTKETSDLDRMSVERMSEMPETFDWRMEVKSNDFMVFSAKKFPGLAESTALSRTVAEQGCRVRIRRDVRMRRREGKSAARAAAAAPTPTGEMEDEFARRHRTQTPEVKQEYRARSLSTESVARTPYGPDVAQRRPSIDHYHTAPSPQPGPSMPPTFGAATGTPAANSNHLRFGGQHPATYTPSSSVPPSPTYGTPTHPAYAQPQPQPQPQQQPQHPQHAQHHSSSSFSAPSPSPSQTLPPSSHSYYQDRSVSQHPTAPSPISIPTPSPVATVAASPKRESFSSSDYHRRMSVGYATGATLVAEPAMERPREEPRQIPPMVSPIENKTMTLPSLSEVFAYQDKAQPSGSISAASSSGSSSSNSGDRVTSLSQLLLPQPVLPPPTAAPVSAKKRSYNQYTNVDTAEAYNSSIKNHARQAETAPAPAREFDELWWKRADGSVWTAHGELYPKA